MPDVEKTTRIALLIQNLEEGGVERCFLNLARGFAERRIQTDLYVQRFVDERLLETAPGVAIFRLAATSKKERAQALANELGNRNTTVVLTGKEEDYRLIRSARERMERPPRNVKVASLNYSGQLGGRQAGPLRRWRRYRQVRQLFSDADQIFCVSKGVARDTARILRRAQTTLPALPNPVVTPELYPLSHARVDHPWLQDGQPPVILGVGRLSLIKNFPLLVRAFAKARREMPMRLLILGEGKQRAELLRLADRLAVAGDVSLPGFRANPYPYMRHAALFVLSSLWEGFGNVLVEALACGTPVVATDCPSGPSEILQDGKYGPLVPVNDSDALAAAILSSLRHPRPPELRMEAVRPYTLENSVSAYLAALGISASI